jgi:hypothetical protein
MNFELSSIPAGLLAQMRYDNGECRTITAARLEPEIAEAPEPINPHPATAIRLADAIEVVADAFQRDHVLRTMIINRLGGFDHIESFRPNPAMKDLVLTHLRAIEISIADNGKPKSDDPRRGGLRYGTTVQAYEPGTRPGKPSWKANGDLRSPERMESDIALTRAGNRKINLPEIYRDWLTSTVIPVARAKDMLIAPLLMTGKGFGTEYCDRVVLLMPKETVEGKSREPGVIITASGAGKLPEFTDRNSDGSALGGRYFISCRGIQGPKRGDSFQNWATGDFLT